MKINQIIQEAGTGLEIDRSIPGRTIARISGDVAYRTGSPTGKKLPDYHPDDDYTQWSGKVGASIHDDEEDTFDADYMGDDGELKEFVTPQATAQDPGLTEDDAGDVEQRFLAKMEKEKQRLAKLKQTDPEAYRREIAKRKTSGKVPPVSTFEEQGVAEEISTTVNLPKWEIGLPVFVKHLSQKGTIDSLAGDSAIVSVGMRQYRVPLSGLKRYPSKGMAEGVASLPDRNDFDSDNDYYDALDAYAKPQNDDSDYENWAFDDTNESKDKVGNMDADAFDAALSRMKKLAGAGPLKTVWDPAKRVYKNVPTAVQPAQQPRKEKK